MQDLLSIADHMAVAVFAISGALMASRKQMDIFGFILLGTVTGVGGGSLRDVLLGAPVFWVAAPGYAITCVIVAGATYFLAHLVQSRFRLILWLDAVGLALFAVLGAAKALGLEPTSLSAREPERQVEALRALPRGSVAVVCGHSNTVPDLVRRLGAEVTGLEEHPRYGEILPHDAYDRLFLVTLSTEPKAATHATEMRYGE